MRKRAGLFIIAGFIALVGLTGISLALDGSGTESDPYLIVDANDLLAVAADTNDYDKSFKLTADIDLAGNTFDRALIGYDFRHLFTGSFDGDGHVVSNLSINGVDYLGLFACIGEGGSVSNLGVIDANIIGADHSVGPLAAMNYGSVTGCSSTGIVNGGAYVGGLVAYNGSGTLTSCYAAASVSGNEYAGGLVAYNASGSLTSCYAAACVYGSEYAGGLVACNASGSLTSCYAAANVSGNKYAGGLVAYNTGSLTGSYSAGNVAGDWIVGGLVGQNYGTVTSCYSRGAVTAMRYVTCAGGLIGKSTGNVTHCYSTGHVSGDYVGGLLGYKYSSTTVTGCFWDLAAHHTSAGGVGLPTAQMQDIDTYLSAGWDFAGEVENGADDVWTICEGTDYPRFVWQIPPGDTVCPDGVSWPDFCVLADNWLRYDCDPNQRCDGADLDLSGAVDVNDLLLFARQWLNGIDLALFQPRPPTRATDPDPAHGASMVATAPVLTWTPGWGALSHNVYFGTVSPGQFRGNQTEALFDPGTLESGTYYWRIDEVGANGKTTGPVWVFYTHKPPPPPKPRACFTSDMPVWLDGSLVPISTLATGQSVAIAGPSLALSRPRQIRQVQQHFGIFECWDIILETGRTLTVADEHYLLLAGTPERWISSRNLKAGAKLQSVSAPITVKAVLKRPFPLIGTVYNLDIAGSDRYFVGLDGIVARDY